MSADEVFIFPTETDMSNNNVITLANRATCACECGGTYSAAMTQQSFPYGEGDARVELEAIVPVWTCDACGDAYTDGDAEKIRHAAVCKHLGRLSPEELTKLRTMRGMSQDEWAEYTAIGVASIKRWETGSLIQNASFDRFLRLLSDNIANARYTALRICESSSTSPAFRNDFSERELRDAAGFQLRLRRA